MNWGRRDGLGEEEWNWAGEGELGEEDGHDGSVKCEQSLGFVHTCRILCHPHRAVGRCAWAATAFGFVRICSGLFGIWRRG